ncbi:MAG: RIP metalloprotease RseP [Bacteroidota bacterium]
MAILNNIIYFLITIGILVFIHELGHFLAAKLSGMRVERFSIGFPPRAFGKKIGDTDYCVSWIPIGGYVKISGMIDESFDTEFLQKEPQPWEFRSKSYPKRIFVITAGVLMNFVLAILIFWGINAARGKVLWQTTDVGYVLQKTPAAEAGFKAGDKILAVNGEKVSYWSDLYNLIYVKNLGNDIAVDVDRDGRPFSILLPRKSIPEATDEQIGLIPKHTAVVIMTVDANRPAAKLGLQPQDTIIALNGTPVFYSNDVLSIVGSHAGKEVNVEWKRDLQRMSGSVIPDSDGRIGISINSVYNGPIVRTRYNIFAAFPEGISDFATSGVSIVKSVWQIVTGKVSIPKSVAGPIRIAQLATSFAEVGILNFINFVALLSMSLAILNILPFPALDGGHLLFLIIEAVFRREIPHRVKIALQQVGFILLLAFMAFVIYNDIMHF